MNWYEYPIVVPFGNPNYDSQLGGSHDMDVAPPPNCPVTALLPGTVCDLSAPSWGKQVGLQLDTPYNGVPYMAYLHLSAINPQLVIGGHVDTGDLIGWVGGATQASQYAGTANPTGQNFLNAPIMSSQIQVGIALMRGPVYGDGSGWVSFPPIDMSLDPTQIILDAVRSLMTTVDYPGASPHFVPDSYTFTSNAAKAIVIHKTASGGAGGLQSVYNTFMSTMRSTHYGIDLDGTVWQFVPESRGAGGNCCLETGHNSFWDQYTPTYPNLNLCTFSIEHVDPSTDNSTPMPQAQVDASHKLVAYLCKKYRIDTLHIHSHASLDPLSKARCPGPTYDFTALFAYINNGGTPPVNTFDQEASDCWIVVWNAQQKPPPPQGTGIFNSWKSAWAAGKQYGPPLTWEYNTVDGAGNKIIAQEFAHARCEWRNNTPFWYSIGGAIV